MAYDGKGKFNVDPGFMVGPDPSEYDRLRRQLIDELGGVRRPDGGYYDPPRQVPARSRHEQELEQALRGAQDVIKKQEAVLKRIAEAPMVHGCIVMVDGDRVLVAAEGRTLEVQKPTEFSVAPGQLVRLNVQTMQIVSIVLDPLSLGEITTVTSVKDRGMAEVEFRGASRIVAAGTEQLETGDRVVVDPTGAVVMKRLGKDDNKFTFDRDTKVDWDDVVGLEQAKADMIEAIELPITHADLFKKYGKSRIKGVLLYGPPGCGKTMLGKAAASAVARLHGGKGTSGFIYVKGPEILNKFVGESEARIRSLFQSSREHMKKTGNPAVIFIDEADAVLGKRGNGRLVGMEQTLIPQFLSEMDGLDDAGAIVLLSTNRPDVLDPAVVRDGRVDRKILVGRPSKETVAGIMERQLRRRPLSSDIGADGLASYAADVLFDDANVLYYIVMRGGKEMPFTLARLVNGAMAVGIVEQATSLSMRREMSGKPGGGIFSGDLEASVKSVLHQNLDLNHSDELEEFVSEFKKDVIDIRKVKRT